MLVHVDLSMWSENDQTMQNPALLESRLTTIDGRATFLFLFIYVVSSSPSRKVLEIRLPDIH